MTRTIDEAAAELHPDTIAKAREAVAGHEEFRQYITDNPRYGNDPALARAVAERPHASPEEWLRTAVNDFAATQYRQSTKAYREMFLGKPRESAVQVIDNDQAFGSWLMGC